MVFLMLMLLNLYFIYSYILTKGHNSEKKGAIAMFFLHAQLHIIIDHSGKFEEI